MLRNSNGREERMDTIRRCRNCMDPSSNFNVRDVVMGRREKLVVRIFILAGSTRFFWGGLGWFGVVYPKKALKPRATWKQKHTQI